MIRNIIATGAAIVFAVAAAPRSTLASDGNETEQVHRSVEGFSRDFGERGSATTAQLKEQRVQSADVLSKPRSVATSVVSSNAWIYDADAVLYDDFDDDGYFRFVSVRFDADTYVAGMYVYAMLYLSEDGETWNHYYTTEDFHIDGTVPDDEYFVETELIQGFPPGLYDVLIELYDADFGTYEDEFGPAESSALSLLPIEDAGYDEPIQISISSGHGGGGALAPWLLLLVAAVRRATGQRRRIGPSHALGTAGSSESAR